MEEEEEEEGYAMADIIDELQGQTSGPRLILEDDVFLYDA